MASIGVKIQGSSKSNDGAVLTRLIEHTNKQVAQDQAKWAMGKLRGQAAQLQIVSVSVNGQAVTITPNPRPMGTRNIPIGNLWARMSSKGDGWVDNPRWHTSKRQWASLNGFWRYARKNQTQAMDKMFDKFLS